MSVSVVIPARNAATTLPETLDRIAAQQFSGEFEVIVVDDASTDGTGEVADAHPAVARVVRHASALGPGPARNAGAAAARYDRLAFTDADCYPTESWLEAGCAALEAAELVQGGVVPDPRVTPQPFDRSITVRREVGLYETANLLITRDLFDRLGGFEDWLGARIGKPLAEDLWLGWRARRSGASVAFAPQCLVHHAVFRRSGREHVMERVRLTYFPDIVEKVPELRSTFLLRGYFINRRSLESDVAATGLAAALWRRSPLPLVASLPYLRSAYRGARPWGRQAPRVALIEAAADAVGMVALLVGSIRRRTPVL